MGETTNKPKDTDFVQQRLKAFQPVHTIETTVAALIGLSLLFFVFGTVLYSQAGKIIESSSKYSDCGEPVCNVTFQIEGNMREPIYLYYELRNFYQNHRTYRKSKSYAQLRGEDLEASSLSDCGDNLYGDSLYVDQYLDGSPIGDKDIANPCGLCARSMFNDTFMLFDYNDEKVKVLENKISWESDNAYLYIHTDDYEKKQWTDVEDEHFIVWMRTGVTKNFRKLWGRVPRSVMTEPMVLESGFYTVQVQNNYNVSGWGGEKHFIITNANSLGGQNYFLGMIFVFTSLFCCFSSLFFCGRAMISKKGSLTADDLSW